MNTPQYDAYEQSLNEVASGVTLFLTALVDTLREIDRLPPEGRTTTVLVEHLASVLEILEGREYVTQAYRDHARSMMALVRHGVQTLPD